MSKLKTIKTCENGHQFSKSSDCPSCPICEQNQKPKEGFMTFLAAPARRALQNNNIYTLDQLTSFSEKQLLNLHGIGKSSLPILKKALFEKGMTFKED